MSIASTPKLKKPNLSLEFHAHEHVFELDTSIFSQLCQKCSYVKITHSSSALFKWIGYLIFVKIMIQIHNLDGLGCKYMLNILIINVTNEDNFFFFFMTLLDILNKITINIKENMNSKFDEACRNCVYRPKIESLDSLRIIVQPNWKVHLEVRFSHNRLKLEGYSSNTHYCEIRSPY